MSNAKPFRLTVIISLILHLAMLASVLMTVSGRLELILPNQNQKHLQMLIVSSPVTQPEVTPEPKPVVKTKAKPEVKPEVKPVVNSEFKTVAKPKSEIKPALKPKPIPEVITKAIPELKPIPESEVIPEPKQEPKQEPEQEPELVLQTAAPISSEKKEIERQTQFKQSQRLGLEDEQIQRYKQEVITLIEAQKYYPKKLRKMRKEGKVDLEFTLHRDGTIHNLQVLSYVGHRLFQNAALGALEKVARFPSFPEEITKTTWTFNITLEYELN